jgi:hypothetical protein
MIVADLLDPGYSNIDVLSREPNEVIGTPVVGEDSQGMGEPAGCPASGGGRDLVHLHHGCPLLG